MIYINGKEVKPYVGDYKPLTVYKGTEKLAGWTEQTLDNIKTAKLTNAYSTMKIFPYGKSGQKQNEVNYPEITMTLDSESGNYYLDGITTQNGTPSPDNVVDFVNTYPAGTYQTIINDKTYVITLNDDLRSITKGTTTADRLWLDITNAKAWIDKKVYITVFDNPQGWNQFKENVYTCTWSIPDYGIDITKHSSFARCNYFEEILNSELGTNIGMYTLNSAYLRVSYPGKTLEEFKEWITEKNETGKPLMAIFTLRYPVENLIDQNCYEWNVPSPNNKIDIENLSGDLVVKVVGNNILDYKNGWSKIISYDENLDAIYTTSYTNRILISPENNNKHYLYFKVKKRERGNEYPYNASWNLIKNGNVEKYNTGQDSEEFIELKYELEAGNKWEFLFYNRVYIKDMMLVVEETTTYEPYKEQTVTFPLGEQKLMKDGYLGENGVVNKRKQVVLDGTENYNNLKNNDTTMLFQMPVALTDALSTLATNKTKLICNYFSAYNCYSEDQIKNGICYHNDRRLMIRIQRDLLATQDVAGFKAWLAEQYSAGTPVIVEYEMREEETTAYTEEQQTAYEQLQKLKTYRTVTNISNNQDTNMKIMYKINN